MVRFNLCTVIAMLMVSTGHCQLLEFSDLRKLPTTVNSKGEEGMPLLTNDHSKLFFVRSFYDGNRGGRYAGEDIWCSEYGASGLKPATNNFEAFNDKDNNALIGMSADNKAMYLMNSAPTGKLEGFYVTKLMRNTWTEPQLVPVPGIQNQDFVGIFVSQDFDVLFLSMKGPDSHGDEDLYISTKSPGGNWSVPKNLGSTINTNGFEISPFLSTDKKRLYFASNGHSGFGDADIFYCERLYNSWETWSAPVNLGPVVNSKSFDAYFSIYGDSIAFFSSNRDQQFADIYSVKVTVKNKFLANGQKYLSDDDWKTIVGKNVNAKIIFSPNSAQLSASQKELLYYMANKLNDKKDINIHLIVTEQDNDELTTQRLKEIYGELRQAGIEADRIHDNQNPESITTSKQGVIEIKLFK
jgi:hypothetical protein